MNHENTLITPDLTTTSLIVAEKFGKAHKNVLQAIESLKIPPSFSPLNTRMQKVSAVPPTTSPAMGLRFW